MSDKQNPIVGLCEKIANSGWFQSFILIAILAAAVLVGVETYPGFSKTHHGTLHFLNQLVLYIFVVEALIKMLQYGKQWYKYFQDPWNLFDFTIVVVCFLPVNASYAAVFRLARIMRALRLMTALPQLQLIVGALIRSIPSMGYVGILLALNFYVYAVMGVFLFAANDPIHFRDLPNAMLSLFRVVTLEDWTDVMYINMFGSDQYGGYESLTPQINDYTRVSKAMPLVGAAYFVSFVMFGTMIMLNLFIGVIINSMDEARDERAREEKITRANEAPTVQSQIEEINLQMEQLQESLSLLRSLAKKN